MPQSQHGIIDIVTEAMPEVTEDSIDDWDPESRSTENIHAVLVKLDPVIADMTYTEFCDAVMDAGTGAGTVFSELLEVYERPGPRQSVFRITGTRVSDAPRYFLDSTGAFIFLHGRLARGNVATALYDTDAFDEQAHTYIDQYRLFTPDTRANRTEEIRHANSLIDLIESDELTDRIEEFSDQVNRGDTRSSGEND